MNDGHSELATELYGTNPHIRSFAILTASNPLADVPAEADSTANDVERSRMAILNRINAERDNELVAEISRNGWRFRKVDGFRGCHEKFLMIVNISLKDAKALAAEYSQQSFIFGSRAAENLMDRTARGGGMPYRFYTLADNRVADLRRRYTSSGMLPNISPSEYQAETGFNSSIPFRQAEFDDSLREAANDLSAEVDSDASFIGESRYEDYHDQYFKGSFSGLKYGYGRIQMVCDLRRAAEYRMTDRDHSRRIGTLSSR